MTGTRDWQGKTGESWAAEWKRTDRSFAGVTERLLARTREFPFRDALDIGCGAGELAVALARGYPQARVVGIDISPALVATARTRGENHSNLSFAVADAAAWQPDESFLPQLLISRHGVMFFGDPPAAFAHLAGIAAPDASLLFSCFRGREENPFFTAVAAVLPPPAAPPDPFAPGPFAFADRGRVSDILTAGGWSEPAFEPLDVAMVAGAGEDPEEDAMGYFQRIGPAAEALRGMDGAARARTLEALRDVVRDHCRDGVVALRAAVWIVTSRRS